ncbi:MAG: phosphate/phosphite/phosphonate ABC transporter substrate-binding protein [Acidiferrobacterales bacterium]
MSPVAATRRRPSLRRTFLLAVLALTVGLFAQTSPTEEIPAAAISAYALLSGLVNVQLTEATAAAREQYVLSAPPGQMPAVRAKQIYGAIASYLSRVSGKNIIYRDLGDWRAYAKAVREGRTDLAFDSAHFASWRIAKTRHEPLAKMAAPSAFVVLARYSNKQVRRLDDLVGRRLCARARPNQDTLTVYSRYDNPARQPVLQAMSDSRRIYDTMMAGGCDGAVVPLSVYHKLNPDSRYVRVLFRSDATPGPTLTVSPRLSPAVKAEILHALLSPEGQQIMAPLCKLLGADQVVGAVRKEYAGLDAVLRDTWGFDI